MALRLPFRVGARPPSRPIEPTMTAELRGRGIVVAVGRHSWTAAMSTGSGSGWRTSLGNSTRACCGPLLGLTTDGVARADAGRHDLIPVDTIQCRRAAEWPFMNLHPELRIAVLEPNSDDVEGCCWPASWMWQLPLCASLGISEWSYLAQRTIGSGWAGEAFGQHDSRALASLSCERVVRHQPAVGGNMPRPPLHPCSECR